MGAALKLPPPPIGRGYGEFGNRYPEAQCIELMDDLVEAWHHFNDTLFMNQLEEPNIYFERAWPRKLGTCT